jgi:hypothetical protein
VPLTGLPIRAFLMIVSPSAWRSRRLGRSFPKALKLSDAQWVFERQDDDGGAEPDPFRALGGCCEEREDRRQPTLAVQEVVLGDPAGVEAELFGQGEQVQGDPVGVGGVSAGLQAGEESKSHAHHFPKVSLWTW